jgi:hypothetical protein
MLPEKDDNLMPGIPGNVLPHKDNLQITPEDNPVIVVLLKMMNEHANEFVKRKEFEKDILQLESKNSEHDKLFVPRQEFEKDVKHLESKIAEHDKNVDSKIEQLQSKYADSTNLRWLVGIALPVIMTFLFYFMINSLKEEVAKTDTRLQTSIKERTTEDKVLLIIEKRIAEETNKKRR